MMDTLDAFVRDRLAETATSNPGLHASLQEVGGMLLMGTMGIEVALKPDGSVWVREEEMASTVRQPWRIASVQERAGFLNDASEKVARAPFADSSSTVRGPVLRSVQRIRLHHPRDHLSQLSLSGVAH